MTRPTKQQLDIKGELLLGPIVPEWFIKQSDGASLPFGTRRLLKKELADAAGYVHDFEYFGCATLFEPYTRPWHRMRNEADHNLKYNAKLIVKRKPLRFLVGRIFLRGVRIGGGYAMKKDFKDLTPPPTLADLHTTMEQIANMNWGQLTPRAITFQKRWEQNINR